LKPIREGIGMSRATAVTTLCIVALSVGVASCGHAEYITPDYREYTTGGVFLDKYWNTWSGAKVRLEGEFVRASSKVVGGPFGATEKMVFYIEVPNGLQPVTVYAKPRFAQQIYEKTPGQRIVVYGTTLPIESFSREDNRLAKRSLAVDLDRLK
jgi:hypothetical protein